MRFDFKNDPKADDKKKELMREVTTTEPFLEAWPSIIIMTIIWLSVLHDSSFDSYCRDDYNYRTHEYNDKECDTYMYYGPNNVNTVNNLPPKCCTNHPENSACAVYGGFGGKPWFFTTYAISIITGALGITKFLQVGPFSVLTTEGALSGLCKCNSFCNSCAMICRFFLAFLAVMASMLTKGTVIAIIFYFLLTPNLNSQGQIEDSEAILRMLLLRIGPLILPNLLFSWISIGCSTGFNKKLMQVILAYPAAWMLPITSLFVIGPQKLACSSKTNIHRYHLGFSKPYTIINITLTMIMYAFILSYDTYIIQITAFICPVIFVITLFLNFIFLLSDAKCCCSCCCTDCCKHETYVIATNTLKLDIVKIED